MRLRGMTNPNLILALSRMESTSASLSSHRLDSLFSWGPRKWAILMRTYKYRCPWLSLKMSRSVSLRALPVGTSSWSGKGNLLMSTRVRSHRSSIVDSPRPNGAVILALVQTSMVIIAYQRSNLLATRSSPHSTHNWLTSTNKTGQALCTGKKFSCRRVRCKTWTTLLQGRSLYASNRLYHQCPKLRPPQIVISHTTRWCNKTIALKKASRISLKHHLWTSHSTTEKFNKIHWWHPHHINSFRGNHYSQ